MTKLFALGEIEGGDDVLFTPWSIVHFLSGATARKLGINEVVYQFLHFAYETKDQIKDNGNTILNSYGDQLTTTVGYYIPNPLSEEQTLFVTAATFAFFVMAGDRLG